MEQKKEFCKVCPRGCNVDRTISTGFCNENDTIKIAKVIKNFKWEEPCITGEKGCLAIFFSGCNLRCDYCQNYEISRGGVGKDYTINEFCKLIEENQDSHSFIDLITPTHFSAQLSLAFSKLNKKIPVIWNTNSYETPKNIKDVSKFVDIFLADLKYCNDEIGREYSKCPDYFSFAFPAIKEMCALKPDIIADDIMKQGVIIRHLVLPGFVRNSIEALDMLAERFGKDITLSLMSQFTPVTGRTITRKLKPIEYKAVVAHAEKLGIADIYIQTADSASEEFIPKWEK